MSDQQTYEQEKLEREKAKGLPVMKPEMKKVTKQIIIWLSVLVGLGLIVWAMAFLIKHYEPNTAAKVTIENKIQADDWVKGKKDSKVILTEYSDFQCPACGSYFPLVQKVTSDYGDRIAFVYRHFPLNIHPNAIPMAIASEAAGVQGKFWEMYVKIFTNQPAWSNQNKTDVRNTAIGYAKELGLNVAKFQTDYDSPALQQKIEGKSQEALNLGLTYTPSFFINGKLITNPKSYDEFKAVLDKALDENK